MIFSVDSHVLVAQIAGQELYYRVSSAEIDIDLYPFHSHDTFQRSRIDHAALSALGNRESAYLYGNLGRIQARLRSPQCLYYPSPIRIASEESGLDQGRLRNRGRPLLALGVIDSSADSYFDQARRSLRILDQH